MSDRSTSTATHRRARYAILTAVLLTASTASLVLALSLASRIGARIDVTATREHSLSARTRAILGPIEGPHRIIVSVDSTSLDPRSSQRISDLLIEFDEASPEIEIVRIDTSTPQSLPAFEALLRDLTAENRPTLDTLRDVLARASQSASELAGRAVELDGLLKSARDAYAADDPRHTSLNELAGYVRQLPDALGSAAENSATAADRTFAGVGIPDVGAATDAVVPALENAATIFETAARYMDVLLSAERRPDTTPALEGILQKAQTLRDNALLSIDAVASLDRPDVLDIARALQSGDVILVSNPQKTTAIDFRSLFPPTALIDATNGGGAEITFAGEELIATAISSINNPRNPVLVITHGQTARIFDEAGRPTTYAKRSFGSLLSRLRLRGFDLREWHTATEEQPPARASLDPTGERPVVYFVFGPPTADAPTDAAGTTQAQRAIRLAGLRKSLRGLLEARENVLLSLGLSDLAALGEPDPLASLLEPFGIEVRSDLMLLNAPQTASVRRAFLSEHRLTRADADHPIANAVDGLAITLPSPMPMRLSPRDGVETTALLTLRDTDSLYGESEWARLPHPVSEQPMALRTLPTLDENRDALVPTDGDAWTLAASSTHAASGQRLVCVASHVWFADLITQRQAQVEGRNIWINPGNLEFLEASIYWLAGLDELIAPSPHTLDIPRIKPLDETQIALIRWTLAAVLPLVTLLLGIALRFLRP